MIQSLYNLGLALKTSKKPEHEAYFASYADPFAGFDGDRKVIIIEIKDDEVQPDYDQVDFQPDHAWRYLFRDLTGSNGYPIVPTGYLKSSSLSTDNQIKQQKDHVSKVISRIQRSIPNGQSIFFSSTESKNKGLLIAEKILNKIRGNKGTRYIYTMKIDGLYLGEIDELRNRVDEESVKEFYEESKSQGKTCSLSYDQNVEVWGRATALGFSVTQKNIVHNRGGFDPGKSYRMFPVSKKAMMMLEAGKRYAFANLSNHFYNLEYLLIPRYIGDNSEATLEIVEEMGRSKHNDPLEKKDVPILKAGGLIDVIADEGEINKAGVLIDVLFYQKNQAQLALLLHLQDVPPTRFGEIKEAVNQTSYRYGKAFGYVSKKENIFKAFYVNFGVMKNFFSEGKGLKIRFDPIFYRLLECIFYGESLSEETVVTALVDQIRIAFKNDGDDYHIPFHTTVHQAIATRTLLGRLGLFNHPNYYDMEDHPITLRREQYLEEHAGFFKDQPALKGAFLLGLLTSMLTYAQYDHLRSKPFLNKLNNLNMGQEELRALIPQLLNKIQQYQSRKSGYAPSHQEVTTIAAEASSLLMQGGRPSRDDLSFAFATGLVMQDKFGMDIAAEKKAAKEAEAPAE